jgi:hypothetical protein
MVHDICFGSKILLTFPDYSEDPEHSFSFPTDNFASLAGSWRQRYGWSSVIRVKNKYSYVSPENIQSFNELFDYCFGRYHYLWIPSWNKDLVLTQPIVTGDDHIHIEDIDYDINYPLFPGTGRFLFFYKSNSKYEMASVRSVTDKTTLNLHYPMNYSFALSELKYVCFLYLVRFDQDEIEWEYIAPREAAQLTVEFAELPLEYSAMLPSPASLDRPLLTYPITGTISNARPVFRWERCDGASHYIVSIIDSAGTILDNVRYSSARLADPKDSTLCRLFIRTDLSDGDVTWRVMAWSPDFGYSLWSTSITFTVAVITPRTITLISPLGVSSDPTPTYKWKGDALATHYYLWVNDSTGIRIQVWYTLAELTINAKGHCSITPAYSMAPGNCQWWIQAYNANGYSEWSEMGTFLMQYPKPLSAITTSPVGGIITGSTPTYIWTASRYATYYYFVVEDSTGIVIQEICLVSTVDPGDTGTCSYTPETSLANGPHKWYVQPWNPEGSGPWSVPKNFTVSI